MERDEITAEEAREKMLAWANGALSHANFYRSLGSEHIGPAEKAATEAALALADAAETQKWAAVYTALIAEEPSLARRVVNAISGNDRRELEAEARRAISRLREGRDNCEHERRQASERGHKAGSAAYEIAFARRRAYEDTLSVMSPVFKKLGVEE